MFLEKTRHLVRFTTTKNVTVVQKIIQIVLKKLTCSQQINFTLNNLLYELLIYYILYILDVCVYVYICKYVFIIIHCIHTYIFER